MISWPERNSVFITGYTIAAGAIGAGLAYWLSFPVFILTGPAILITALGLLGLRFAVMNPVRDAAFVIIGIGIGGGVDAQAKAAFLHWPVAFLAMAVMLLAILFTCRFVLTRWFGYDQRSAILAASPGHLSYVLSLSASLDVNVTRIAIVQSVRVLALILLVPFVAMAFGMDVKTSLTLSGEPMQPVHLLALLSASVAIGLVLKWLKIPAPLLLGGLISSALAHVTEVIPGTLSPAIALPGFLVLGTMIGTRFSGVTFSLLRTTLLAALVTTAISVAFAVLLAWPVAIFLQIPLAHVLVAFAPGGLETMIAMGAVLGADPGFVAAIHVGRLLILTVLVPLMLGRSGRPTAQV